MVLSKLANFAINDEINDDKLEEFIKECKNLCISPLVFPSKDSKNVLATYRSLRKACKESYGKNKITIKELSLWYKRYVGRHREALEKKFNAPIESTVLETVVPLESLHEYAEGVIDDCSANCEMRPKYNESFIRRSLKELIVAPLATKAEIYIKCDNLKELNLVPLKSNGYGNCVVSSYARVIFGANKYWTIIRLLGYFAPFEVRKDFQVTKEHLEWIQRKKDKKRDYFPTRTSDLRWLTELTNRPIKNIVTKKAAERYKVKVPPLIGIPGPAYTYLLWTVGDKDHYHIYPLVTLKQ